MHRLPSHEINVTGTDTSLPGPPATRLVPQTQPACAGRQTEPSQVPDRLSLTRLGLTGLESSGSFLRPRLWSSGLALDFLTTFVNHQPVPFFPKTALWSLEQQLSASHERKKGVPSPSSPRPKQTVTSPSLVTGPVTGPVPVPVRPLRTLAALGAVAAVPCPALLPCPVHPPAHSPQSARNNNLPQGEPLVDYARQTGCPPPSWSPRSHGTSSSRRPLLLHRATG